MYDRLYQHISRLVSLTDDEFTLLKTLFIPKKLRRKHYLLQEGDVCKAIAFVEKGLLRAYTIDTKGTEHILQFAPEDWWISDMYSYLTGEPSDTQIDALEDSELLLLERINMDLMVESVPKMERFFRITLQNNYIATQRRIKSALSQSAEEKYADFIHRYPAIVQRVPQHMIASYLGITPAFLSRIRSRKPHSD
ncbi:MULTISPECIES: Crp/Fnr family transcriptional regulator [unclassified Spirosoma]|uniref:Crp/Fnr family transcriptional regulator n=1 Tax=unclassified Spirosoma TaxID=2621999 RepID=UPI0009638CDC|nr:MULTISPECIES: Crp/Fnr family transcriptional regulator [unclassified Spirosoma]MBN8822068.1 Crp/Fnr family transcriptional regulator [Spirosoma sp.]OJW80472.1 MAG: cyclic nucleotide-binding protein [Spirosoma sp. 48-14]